MQLCSKSLGFDIKNEKELIKNYIKVLASINKKDALPVFKNT